MTRERSAKSREGATLGDALSPLVKDRLHRLRETLEKRVRAAVESQLVEVRPPWRRPENAVRRPEPPKAKTVSRSTLPSPTGTQRQRSERTSRPVLDKAKAIEPEPATPKPKIPPFAFWDFPTEQTVREPPCPSISDADRSRFEKLLRVRTISSTARGEALIVILGLDFGTSSTKMIIRLPYEAGKPTIAIPAPAPCRRENNPYLWQTVLWLQEDGTFCPWPEKGAMALNSLKQGLIQARSETLISSPVTPIPVTRSQAGVAYLAYVIRYVRGWLQRNRPSLFRGRKSVWLVNLGMPTASYDDTKLTEPYRRMAAAALQLAKIDSPVTVEATRLFLDDPHVAKAGVSEEAAEGLGVAVFPETAAEMTGFAKSTRNAPGLYLLVDVGAMTLDACMFRLNQDANTGDLYAFMTAQVRPLGVDSFHWFKAQGKTDDDFIQQCKRALWAVVWNTKKCRDPNAKNWQRGNDLPVFFVGGGAANQLHREIVKSLGPWLKQHVQNDGIRLLELPVPSAIECPEPLPNFGRMAVAWGLSYPPKEIGQIQAMSDIEDIPPYTILEHDTRFISKDDV